MKANLYIPMLILLLAAAPIRAQDDWNDGPPVEDPADQDETNEQETEVDGDQAFLTDTEKAEIEAPAEETDTGLHEDPETPYFSVGGRLRWIMIPAWFIRMFGVDSTRASRNDSFMPLVSNVGVGPEFIYRKDGFDITAAIWYAGFGWRNPISFKDKDDGPDGWEVVENDLHAIVISADFLWSTSFKDWVAITYGAGLGLGIPWGDLIRTEATLASRGTEKCKPHHWYPSNPEGDEGCNDGEEDNEAYDKLKVIPWINLLIGARFKPHRHVAIYVDGGFGFGFQIGTRVGYIF
ncbi:MAG: hypothetical protein GY847_08635 [Proteobacteria bacterium]|nr:hypothetical protein [Pseudomonadota bacterium]